MRVDKQVAYGYPARVYRRRQYTATAIPASITAATICVTTITADAAATITAPPALTPDGMENQLTKYDTIIVSEMTLFFGGEREENRCSIITFSIRFSRFD